MQPLLSGEDSKSQKKVGSFPWVPTSAAAHGCNDCSLQGNIRTVAYTFYAAAQVRLNSDSAFQHVQNVPLNACQKSAMV